VTTDPYPPPADQSGYMNRVLRVFAFENCDSLFWRGSGPNGIDGPIVFSASCSDFFWWGTADVEEITYTDVPALEQALLDLKAVTDYPTTFTGQGGPLTYDWTHLAGELYAARKRQMRPQGAAYSKDWPPAIIALFDACGPVRDTGLGNPRPSPAPVDSVDPSTPASGRRSS
jgi:hypothetical protein